MTTSPRQTIRETLLMLIKQRADTVGSGNLQQSVLLDEASEALRIRHRSIDLEQALLTEWQDLFRTGLLAWGHNLMNPNPPFFHLTERGRGALASVGRDPS